MDLSQLIGNYPLISVTLLVFATMGGVELIKALFRRNWEDAAIIAVSALLPAVLAAFVDGVTPLVGAVIGLGASGLVTGVSFVGVKRTP